MRQVDLQRLATATRLGIDIVTDELGTVHVDAVDRAGSVHVKLGSDDLGVRTLLADRANELRATLGADGVSIESLDVGTRGDRGAGGSNGGSATPRDGNGVASSSPTGGRSAQLSASPSSLDSSPAASANSSLTVDGHVDLRI